MRRGRLLSLAAVPVLFLGQCAPDACAPEPPPAGFGGGVQLVGTDVAPGLYASLGDSCYWERLSGLGGTFDEIIANDFSDGHHLVEIGPSDVAFSSDRCGRWTQYAAPPAPNDSFGDGDWSVGQQVVAGRWASDLAAMGCYWERASGFGHDFGEIIANDFLDQGRAVVDIAVSDARFTTSGCGTWSRIG